MLMIGVGLMCRRRRNKRIRKFIVVIVVGIIFTMTAGYAVMQTNISIGAKGNVVQKLVKPTFELVGADENYNRYVVITFPEGCAEKYTCSFTKNGNEVPVKNSIAKANVCGTVNFSASVSDGATTLTESAAYDTYCFVRRPHCVNNTCLVYEGYETIDWENSNSFMYNVNNDYPVDMLEDFEAMKAEIDSYGTEEAIVVINSLDSNSVVLPFALYDYNYDSIINEDGRFEIEIVITNMDLSHYENLAIVYYSWIRGIVDVGLIENVDYTDGKIQFTIEEISQMDIMFLIGYLKS